jgi:hypothetical protein
LQAAVSGFDPLDWWLIGFVMAGLAVGIASGFFRTRKIEPKG